MKILSIVLGMMFVLTLVGCDEMENPFTPKEAVAAEAPAPTAKIEEVTPFEVEEAKEELKPIVEEAAPKCGGDTSKPKTGGDKKAGKCGEGKCGGN